MHPTKVERLRSALSVNDAREEESGPASAISVLVVDRTLTTAREAFAADKLLIPVVLDSITSAVGSIAKLNPAVVVVVMGESSQHELAEVGRLVEAAAPIPVVMVSTCTSERGVVDLIKTGIRGYLFTHDIGLLPFAVHDVLRGGLPLSDSVSRMVLARARRSSAQMTAVKPFAPDGPTVLTTRQHEILKLLAHGHRYEDIGVALDLSVNTVRSHLRCIYEKLGASTKVEAVLIGMELGLLERSTESGR